MTKSTPLLISIFLCLGLQAQDQTLIASLETQLAQHSALRNELRKQASELFDTTAADLLLALSRAYRGNTPEKALAHAQEALVFSQRISYTKGIANAHNAIGVVRFQQGDYPAALSSYNLALQLRQESADLRAVSISYNNIAEGYRVQGNYPEALRQHLAALRVRESIGDSTGIERSYNNIGLIYARL